MAPTYRPRDLLRDTYKLPILGGNVRDNLFSDLEKHIKRFTSQNFDEATISQKGQFGEFNYEILVPGVQFIVSLLNEILDRDLSSIPQPMIQQITEGLNSATQWIETIKQTNGQDSLGDYVRKHTSEIAKDITQRANDLVRILAYTGALSVSIEPIRDASSEAEKLVTNLKELESSTQANLDTLRHDTTRLLDACRERLQETVVSKQAQKFDSLSKTYADAAYYWLVAVCGIAAVIVSSSVIFYAIALNTTTTVDVGLAVQMVAAKLVVISVLTFLLVAFLRNYRAHRHNQVLAEHRATTLNTFEQFLLATKSDDTRERLLLLVAEAAFNPKQTGYDHADREGGHPMQQFLDLHGVLNKTN